MRRKHIVNRIRSNRRILNFEQKDIAKRFGLRDTAMISRWENGETMPSADNLIKLALLFRRHPYDLYPELVHEYKKELFPEEAEILDKIYKPDSGP